MKVQTGETYSLIKLLKKLTPSMDPEQLKRSTAVTPNTTQHNTTQTTQHTVFE